MFFIESSDNIINIDVLKANFNEFENKRGKLPSFSVFVERLCSKDIRKLEPVDNCGDYTFYNYSSSGYWFSFRDSFLFMSKDYKSANIFLSENLRFDGQFEINYLTMQAYMFRLVDTGNFMIHAAAVVYDDECIMFCGMSGAGKSTQANLWKEYMNCDILNYDKPCIINDNGTIIAHGSPWSGKEKLIKNEHVPLKAIVFVKQATENYVNRIKPAQAFSNIYMHNYVYPINKDIEDKYINIINDIVKNIPVYELFCDISKNAVETLYNELFDGRI